MEITKKKAIRDAFNYVKETCDFSLESQIKLCDIWLSICVDTEEFEMATELQLILSELKNNL